jgi:hypothetical protein
VVAAAVVCLSVVADEMVRLLAQCLDYTITARPSAASVVQQLDGDGSSLTLGVMAIEDDGMEETHI